MTTAEPSSREGLAVSGPSHGVVSCVARGEDWSAPGRPKCKGEDVISTEGRDVEHRNEARVLARADVLTETEAHVVLAADL